jgi:hypothetical protein
MSWLLTVAPCRAPLMLVALMLPSLAHAQDTESSAPGTIDTEHIFGFAEGADIGAQGDRELEITATGLAGKPGQYAGILNEIAFRYGVADGFRASKPCPPYPLLRGLSINPRSSGSLI